MNVNLNALDDRDSLLWANSDGIVQAYAYGPFGSTPARSGNSLLPGFNGERLDPVSQTYHLGNGYRAYTPALMRFNTPDAWSPYGAGGLNPYSYCEGDPINRADPSGHLSGQAWAGIAMGILGLLGAIFSAGMSIAVAGTAEAAFAAASATDVILGVVGGVADVSSIVTGATSTDDPQVSRVAGWVCCVLGAVGAVAGVASFGRSIHAKFRRRAGPPQLLTDEGIEMLPRSTQTDEVAGPSTSTRRPSLEVSLPPASVSGPSRGASASSLADLDDLANKPERNIAGIRFDSEIDGGRVIRNADGNLAYDNGTTVNNGFYHFALSKEDKMYLSGNNVPNMTKSKVWISVNVEVAGTVFVSDGRFTSPVNTNSHYRRPQAEFKQFKQRMHSLGVTDRNIFFNRDPTVPDPFRP